jgi:hypothetical protein
MGKNKDRKRGDKPSVEVKPIISTDRLGHPTGGGASVEYKSDSGNVGGGAYKSSSKADTVFFAQADKGVSDSTTVHGGGSVDTRGAYNISAGVRYKF